MVLPDTVPVVTFGKVTVAAVQAAPVILVAECDLAACAPDKQWFDVVGHCSREEMLVPLLAGLPSTDQ